MGLLFYKTTTFLAKKSLNFFIGDHLRTTTFVTNSQSQTTQFFLKYGVDPLAVYNPVMETEFYGDGQHSGGVYFWGISIRIFVLIKIQLDLLILMESKWKWELLEAFDQSIYSELKSEAMIKVHMRGQSFLTICN